MKPSRGIAADSCVTVDGNCPISCEVVDDQIEFRFGDDESGLHLFFEGSGFVRFLHVGLQMVERYRALPVGTRVDFVVGDGEVEPTRHD